jgi:hypothetical protein
VTVNAIDLYKMLPGKNCGSCSQKACMPFAISLLQGTAVPSGCPLLSVDDIKKLEKSVTRSDWREDLIRSLRLKIRDIDLSSAAGNIGGTYRDGRLFISCLGREFAVTPDGEILSEGHITPWISILLLHYIATNGKADLSGRWVSFSELRNGMVKASSFLREGEEPLKELFDRGIEDVSTALERLRARRCEGFPTPYAWNIFLLPKVPVMVLYWPEEDEFPSSVKVLFDQTADRFLDVESIIFLTEGLVKNIGMILSPAGKE